MAFIDLSNIYGIPNIQLIQLIVTNGVSSNRYKFLTYPHAIS